MIQKTPVPNTPYVPFPFGVEFQAKLVKVMLMDVGITDAVLRYVRPEYFESPPLRWAVERIRSYRDQYNTVPTPMVLAEETRLLNPSIRPLYTQAMHQLQTADIPEEGWIKTQILEWVKRNIFVEAHATTKTLFNAGQVDQAYDSMRQAMDAIEQAVWEKVDRGWLFDESGSRESRRTKVQSLSGKVTSGVHDVDQLLGGGAEPGFMGVWIAYSKGGKSIMLQNNGLGAARAYKKVLHLVLEGNRSMIEDRYDSAFSGESYSVLKAGNMDAKKYAELHEEYNHLRRMLVLRGFTERWDVTILDVQAELAELKRIYGWVPQVIIIDYGDLLSGRKKSYGSGWESDRDAYRDIKSLANQGYVVWTASQVQRPKVKDYLNTEHLLTSKDIAGGYDKVRVADFIASINTTLAEREQKVMRIFPEVVRDAPGQGKILIGADFDTMRFGTPVALGYADQKTIKKVAMGGKK